MEAKFPPFFTDMRSLESMLGNRVLLYVAFATAFFYGKQKTGPLLPFIGQFFSLFKAQLFLRGGGGFGVWVAPYCSSSLSFFGGGLRNEEHFAKKEKRTSLFPLEDGIFLLIEILSKEKREEKGGPENRIPFAR